LTAETDSIESDSQPADELDQLNAAGPDKLDNVAVGSPRDPERPAWTGPGGPGRPGGPGGPGFGGPGGPGGPGHNVGQIDRMGTEKIGKLIRIFAIPAIAGMLANGLYNIIDGIFMGLGVGPLGLATATVSMPLMTFSMAVSMLFGAGGNALFALRLGEGKKEDATRIMGMTFMMLIIAGIIVTTLIHLFMVPVLHISGATDDIIESCQTFVSIISFGVTLQFIGMGFNNFIRTCGDPQRALYTMIVGVVVSTFFNWLLVLMLRMGVAGSAFATVIGQGSSCLMVLFYFTLSKKAPYKLQWKNLPIKPGIALKIMTLGSASFFLQIAGTVIMMFANNLINHYGGLAPIGAENALAGLGVVGRVAGFTFFPIMGVAVAAQPIFGYNYGAKNYTRVKKTFWTGLLWMMCFGMFFWVVVRIFPEQLAMIFGVTNELLTFTAHALQVQLFMVPVMGLQMLSANFFQSTGQPMKSLLLSLSRQILFMVPLVYFLPIVMPQLFPGVFLGIDGIIWSYPISDTLSVVTAALMMSMEFRRINRMIAKQKEEQDQLPPSGELVGVAS